MIVSRAVCETELLIPLLCDPILAFFAYSILVSGWETTLYSLEDISLRSFLYSPSETVSIDVFYPFSERFLSLSFYFRLVLLIPRFRREVSHYSELVHLASSLSPPRENACFASDLNPSYKYLSAGYPQKARALSSVFSSLLFCTKQMLLRLLLIALSACLVSFVHGRPHLSHDAQLGKQFTSIDKSMNHTSSIPNLSTNTFPSPNKEKFTTAA